MFVSLKKIGVLSMILVAVSMPGIAQPHLDPDLKKPKKFENRKLGAEKTETTKFGVPRKFIQNTVTHYNYYFNAAEKLDMVMERAKEMHKDDYSKLLPFYNYDLDRTATFKQDLDSVIYKSTAGVLLHDLRNSYIDNLYLLVGQAYYFRNQLDSAYLTFQFINYSFSPKEADGYDKVIGSNANADEGGNSFSIATKENSSFGHKLWAKPPSRNDGFIWQIRTYIASNEYAEAAGLIQTLRNDPLFPNRLKTSLDEVQAWNFYKQEMYDSCATYLLRSLGNAENYQERSRWEFLLGQLYVINKNDSLALHYYDKSIQHTINPVQEVYARLNSARLSEGHVKDPLARALSELMKMAKREKYLTYRDVIYYMAAEVEQMRNNPENAKALLMKSVQWNVDNPFQRSKSFLALGDISFKQKQYFDASRYYDSVDAKTIDPALNLEAQIKDRKEALHIIVKEMAIINRQDSLQSLASMPEKQRDEIIKKMVRTLRKQQGLKDEEMSTGTSGAFNASNDAASDMFNNTAVKGDWYFYNSSQKIKGANEFKAKWGNRPNIDNWRRASTILGAAIGRNNQSDVADSKAASAKAINFDNLLDKIPTTPEKMQLSNDSIEHATFNLGVALQNQIEDYYTAIDNYEKLLSKFPQTTHEQEALYNLYYCYGKIGMTDKQLAVKNTLDKKYGNGKYVAIINNHGVSPDSLVKKDATVLYDDIYNKFIEGNFDQAVVEKRIADSLYGQKYWTPQMLYIESVYYIRQRNDSTASVVLNAILQRYPNSPMREKTQTLLDVLSRRKEIEDYLTNLQIERPKEDSLVAIDDQIKKDQPEDSMKDMTARANAIKLQQQNNDNHITTALTPKQQALQGIDPALLYLFEKDLAGKGVSPGAKDSLARIARPGIGIAPGKIEGSTKIDSSLLYLYEQQQKQLAAEALARQAGDSAVANKGVAITPALPPGMKIDSSKLNNIPVNEVKSAYVIDPKKPQYIGMIMAKVDPVYVNEAKNAFSRYNRDYFSSAGIELSNVTIDENNKLLLFKGFRNINDALDYLKRARTMAPSEVIPWLSANRYSFILLSESNLQLLQSKKDVDAYKEFLKQSLPSHF